MTPVDESRAALVPADVERAAPGRIGLGGWPRQWVPGLAVSLARLLPALRVLGFLAAVSIVVFIVVRAARDVDVGDLAWWPLVLAFGAAVAWWLLLARGWALLVTGRSRRRDVSTWCRTQALRYLPGGIWAPASRVVIVRGSLLDKLATVAAENVIALCAALAIGGVTLAAAGDVRWLALTPVIAAPLLASHLVARRTRIVPPRVFRATWGYVTGFLAYALSAVLVQTAVSGVQEPLAVAGAAAVAWSVGLVVVLAPSGLGVRELAYVALLSPTFPNAELAAGAVTLRVVTILAELAVLVVVARPTPEPSTADAGKAPQTTAVPESVRNETDGAAAVTGARVSPQAETRTSA
jgi:glycosyltransferase 2 family protein